MLLLGGCYIALQKRNSRLEITLGHPGLGGLFPSSQKSLVSATAQDLQWWVTVQHMWQAHCSVLNKTIEMRREKKYERKEEEKETQFSQMILV